MKQIILIHGRPDREELEEGIVASESHWFPWIKKNLEERGQVCVTPEFPFHDEQPYYDEWVAILKNYNIDPDTVLVSHSMSGGFLLRFLSENPDIHPKKVILVAPGLDRRNKLKTDFMKFEIDPAISERTELHVFTSSDDMESVLEAVEIIKEKIPNIHWHEFIDREHFCAKEFPELLNLLN